MIFMRVQITARTAEEWVYIETDSAYIDYVKTPLAHIIDDNSTEKQHNAPHIFFDKTGNNTTAGLVVVFEGGLLHAMMWVIMK